MRLRGLALFAAVGLLATPSEAGEWERQGPDLPIRLYDLGALTAGCYDFVGERVGVPSDPRETPHGTTVFQESEEPILPFGGVDEQIEHLKVSVEPASWAEPGADMKSMSGRWLVVRQSQAVQDGVGTRLLSWERRFLHTTTIEVRAVRLPVDGEAPTTPEAWNTLLAGPDGGPGVTLTGFTGQRVSGFSGLHRAYVGDYDLGRPGARDVPQARVGIANLGLVADAKAFPSADGSRASVWVQAALADATSWSTVEVAGGRTIEVARTALATIEQRIEGGIGAWQLLDGSSSARGQSRWRFAVRLAANPIPERRPAPGLDLPRLPAGELGPLRLEHFDIEDFLEPRPDRLGRAAPCLETHCAREPMPPETMIDLVKALLGSEGWSEPAALEATRGTLIARYPERALEVVGRLLRTLERALLYRVEIDAEVVEVPAELDLGGGALLPAASGQRLADALAAGTAVRHERLRLTHPSGARNALTVGEVETYLANLGVEPGDAAVSPTPRLVTLLDGIDLDLDPHLSSAGDGVSLDVRFLRTQVQRPIRELQVPLGKIQLPESAAQRLRVSLYVPLGRTAVAGSFFEGGRHTLVLLTPRLIRPGD